MDLGEVGVAGVAAALAAGVAAAFALVPGFAIAVIVLLFALSVMLYGGYRLVMRALEFEQLSATLALPMGYVYLCIPISGLVIVFYQVLILMKPEQFKVADEVEQALQHIADEERKLSLGTEKQS